MSHNPYTPIKNVCYRYNKNEGEIPRINDKVKICHTMGSLDNQVGNIVGFSGFNNVSAIVLFDNYIGLDGSTAIIMPVVCLDLI